MNATLTRITKVACPNCRASIGERCFIAGRIRDQGHIFYCIERQDLADRMFPLEVFLPGSVRTFRANTLSTCKGGSHELCKGFKKIHGIQIACGCLCHKKKKEEFNAS